MTFQQGILGLNAVSKNLDVIGNNVANSSTVGAKSSRVEFADMYATALGGGSRQAGSGVTVAAVTQNFAQGSISSSSNPMDMAINGNGFFQVRTAEGIVRYTRNGQFKIDKDGFIVNNNNNRVMGYAADASGNLLQGQSAPLKLLATAIPPKASTEASITANLNSKLNTSVPSSGSIDFNDASTYNSASSVTAIDANGKDIILQTYYQKSAENVWNVYVTANGDPIGGTPPVPLATITFDSTGAKIIDAVDAAGAPLDVTKAFPTPIPATIKDGVNTLPLPDFKLDLTKLTQYAAGFAVTAVSVDGYPPGQLSGIAVESSGIIQANYSNGQTQNVGQLELASFANLNGLQPLGGNEWARTINSGDISVGIPGSGNLGTLQTGALEESNVDLTAELVNMMIAQRNYQANAQTIKTQDQILQTIVNLR